MGTLREGAGLSCGWDPTRHPRTAPVPRAGSSQIWTNTAQNLGKKSPRHPAPRHCPCGTPATDLLVLSFTCRRGAGARGSAAPSPSLQFFMVLHL